MAARSYTYEAVDGPAAPDAAAGDADDVVEVDYDPAFANMGAVRRGVGGGGGTHVAFVGSASPPLLLHAMCCPPRLLPPTAAAAVRLIGTVGGKRDLKVFERSKLLPFAIGIKTDRRKPEETEW